jgi:hypothetical protein
MRNKIDLFRIPCFKLCFGDFFFCIHKSSFCKYFTLSRCANHCSSSFKASLQQILDLWLDKLLLQRRLIGWHLTNVWAIPCYYFHTSLQQITDLSLDTFVHYSKSLIGKSLTYLRSYWLQDVRFRPPFTDATTKSLFILICRKLNGSPLHQATLLTC